MTMVEEVKASQVLYETRNHITRSYKSNYPPQSSKRNEDGSGVLSSLFSVSGISHLKKKWRDYRNPSKIWKPISLIISARGERLAVAAGNQVTILRKDDDYQEPYGIFSSSNLGIFTHGVWSESHDILGIVDDSDELYFIKANGEEITRIMKRKLKTTFPIIGLIPYDNNDVCGSCSFIILTADGIFHHIEIGQQPAVSSPFLRTLNTGQTVKEQFPKDVYCFHYDPEHSFILVIGSAVNTSLNSGVNSGSCSLCLWHLRPNIDLETVLSFQFEGLYHKPKDFDGQVAYPKVLISPHGQFVATLDVRGCLHLFKLDRERSLLSNFAVGEGLGLQVTHNLSNRGDELLNDNVDFTWWSDHIVTLAKRGGTVTFLDIFTGLKLQDHDPSYMMPVLVRAEQLKGHIFLVESKSTEERNFSFNDNKQSEGSDHTDLLTREISDQFDFSRLWWRLVSISERSVSEMYRILIGNHKYQEAMDFANHHGLDRDEVLKSQWLLSCHGIDEINMFLSKIKDHGFVIYECINQVGQTEDAVKALLAHGLNISDKYRFSESEDYQRSQIWDFRLARLQLLQFRDRLETFMGINMGRFSVQEYVKFRAMPLSEVAVMLAESGKIGALNLLFKRHPYSLSPSNLQILAAVPETIPVQTYRQLLPGRSSPMGVSLRDEDWVECEEMLTFINSLSENHEIDIQIRTELIVKRCQGYVWPSIDELSTWYMKRARDIDRCSGQLENCLSLVDLACSKGIFELQQFHKDISYLYQLIYSDDSGGEICFDVGLMDWEQLSDYQKFRMMLKAVKEENVVQKLHDNAIPFMKDRFHDLPFVTQDQIKDVRFPSHDKDESFLVRWLKEIAMENKLDICLKVIEEGCKDIQGKGFFKDDNEAVNCALQCVYLCTVTDRWSTLATILSKLPQKQDIEMYDDGLGKRLKLAESHIEAGRLLAFYQVPKPMNFFLEANVDEKGVKQILRLMLSKFVRRQPGRSDNDWASMWRDMQCLREKAFPFLDLEYMLTEFCRGLLKAGRFSLASNYLKGTSSVALASEKAENLVIQAAREFFFSASSLCCSEVWKAKECLSLFPSSRQVKLEASTIEALTVKLPNLGVTLLPMQFRQIRDPMEIIKMAITSQPGAYLHVDELIEVAQFLGLNSADDISAVEEAVAREAAVAGDLQLAFDLCLVLAKKGHGLIWDLCAAIARGPALENMDIMSRKQLLGFALCHCDEESICELLHAWKDLDMKAQCDTLLMSIGGSPNFKNQDSSTIPIPMPCVKSIIDLKDSSKLVDKENNDGYESCISKVKSMLSSVAKDLPVQGGTDLESFLRENGKILSFAAVQLPWLLDLSRQEENDKKQSELIPGKTFVGIQMQALITTLSWLVKNGFAPKDNIIASLAKSIMEPPVTEEEDIMGCSFLLNLLDAFSGVEVIEEQLKIRKNYQEICSIRNAGMTYSLLHNFEVDCSGPSQRRELLLRMFKEKHTPLNSDEVNKIDAAQSTFWRQWKLKLEENQRVAEHSRVLEHIIPGVETARFLSGDFNYIETVVFSVVESVKFEKKHILKDLLILADSYGLNVTEVLVRFLSSVLVSEVWTDGEIMGEISEVKEQIIGCASETIKAIRTVVFPAIDGCNKQRLASIYGLLSDCYLQLEETKQSLQAACQFSSHVPPFELAHLYKVIEQECQRVSSIKNLNFKNIAGLDGLNFQSFGNEVCAHITEVTLEPLAKMVQSLTGIYSNLVPEGFMTWQDVYKLYVVSLLTNLESRARMDFNNRNPEDFQKFISQLEYTYDSSQMYIRLLAPSDALDIMKQYLTVIIPLHDCYKSIPDNSTWQDCIITLLNFWLRLTEEMQEIASNQSSVEHSFHPESLSSFLKVFMRLVMEDIISPCQSWETICCYVRNGVIGDFAVEILIFCKAMIFSGCGYGATSEVFSEVTSQYDVRSTSSATCESEDILHLYTNILEPILKDLESGSLENQNLYHLLSSLSKLEGQLENLQRVRQEIWERMAQFSDNSLLSSQVRVYVLELMQLIRGKNVKGFSAELNSKVLPWEGWDEFLSMSKKNESTPNRLGLVDNTYISTQLTSTLVALKSSQLAAAISQSLEITPDDLLNVETAVSCFLKLCEVSNSNADIEVLQAILEEWEGFFAIGRDITHPAETSEAVSNDWNTDDWDEGWESFQEVESLEKEKAESSPSVHPLHVCWREIFKKLIMSLRFNDILRLIDQSLSKSNGILLDEEDAGYLSQLLCDRDAFVALKVALLLPYESIRIQCLEVVERRLKLEGISDMVGRDHEFFILVISSGIISAIITKPLYSNTCSYLCYLAGNFCRRCQEKQLSSITNKRKQEHADLEKEILFVFRRMLFPSLIAELVKADQQILAGFLVTKYMHTNASLNLINVAEASVRKYLERQLHSLQHDELKLEDMNSCKILENTLVLLKGEIGNLIQSALALLV